MIRGSANAHESASSFLVEGDTCWRKVRAPRAAVLIDAAEYFGALRESLLRAERSIFILGWELHSRTCLRGDDEGSDGAPRRSLASCCVVCSGISASSRSESCSGTIRWSLPRSASCSRAGCSAGESAGESRFELDNRLPLGAAHHEKIVVIDDAVAYCGGIDLTLRRWDTQSTVRSSRGAAIRRISPYIPVHDVQMVVDGEAAEAIGQRARERWRPRGQAVAACPARGDPWPSRVEPDFVDADVGVIRTVRRGRSEGRREFARSSARSVEAICRAERLDLHREQYVTAKRGRGGARGAHASESRARSDRDHVARAARLARGRSHGRRATALHGAVRRGRPAPAYPFPAIRSPAASRATRNTRPPTRPRTGRIRSTSTLRS